MKNAILEKLRILFIFRRKNLTYLFVMYIATTLRKYLRKCIRKYMDYRGKFRNEELTWMDGRMD